MAHFTAVLFLAHWAVAASSHSPRPIFAFESDSLRAVLTRIGGNGAAAAEDSAAPDWRTACDSAGRASIGSGAWYQVEVADLRSGRTLRFPADPDAVRRGLREVCLDGPEAAPERIAAGLRALASRMHVHMREPGGADR